MKKGKVRAIRPRGQWKEFYKFDLTIQTDQGRKERGTIFRKKDDPGVQVGDQITYEKKDNGSIKLQGPGGGWGGKGGSRKMDPKDRRSIERQKVLAEAIKFHNQAGFVSAFVGDMMDEVLDTADQFYDWINEKSEN